MSASFTQPSTDEHSHRHCSNGRPASSTPTSQTPTSGKRSPNHARTFPTNKALARDARGDRSTPCCTDHESSTISVRPKSDASRLSGDWNEEQSSNHQESPEAQLVPGPPGIARRAKAHVPSACVNCKKKHLACETKRPCNRCVQTGKESSCVDVQHKKRGRPRLREDESFRELALGTEYPQAEAYQTQAGVLSAPPPGRRRSKTYRELRSQPETHYVDQRPRTSDPAYSQNQYLQGTSGYAVSSAASFRSDQIPTVLLTPDFVVAQHNRAFSDALSLSFTARGQTLLDLAVSAEREKLQRLQSILRSELQEVANAAMMRGGLSSLSSMPAIEQLDIAQATAGFRTRSEYWTFRLPRDQSRGFPISISLARDGAFFVVLTLIQGTNGVQAMQSPPPGQMYFSPPLLSSSSIPSPPQSARHPHHSHHHHRHSSGPGDVPIPYLTPSTSSPLGDPLQLMQPSHSLAQYKQSSPPRSVQNPYGTPRTNSSGSGSGSDIPQSSPAQHSQTVPRDSLRHLQLPPIRTTPTSDPSSKEGQRRGEQSSPARGSPHSGKRKKRRRVDIGEMLH